ncbi:hypothetical protein B9Z19DRAFT_987704 [Tuber borchii]|uniref:Tetratricopeptide repeat protein 36 n=1 Tax=Tuber borchii TaxID=42251 RepID=A0A2T6ZNW9_TUBBO|nr:hypothetical protein B9Z19DRAFT_987704 [Tuber borchii]
MSTLTINDSTVLTQLFDPESAPTSASPSIDSSLPSDPHTPPDLLQTLKRTELKAIKLAESSHTSLPESRKLLEELTTAHPTYASAHNNLAQVLRMLSAPANEVLPHLNEAIRLSSPSTPTSPLSPLQAKILSQAYTQRAAIHYSMFKQGGNEDMEVAASRDFFEGGRYGNAIAREMAVRTNPYARLCGAIVREAMKKEYGECL